LRRALTRENAAAAGATVASQPKWVNPMGAQVIVSHHVADFDAWRSVFNEHEKVRREHGAQGHALFQSTSDPGKVIIVNRFETEEAARAFMSDPSLAEAMQRAGVDSAPDVHICREIEDVEY
jgi:heme-degrading monooxygenase HmoA